jgi:AP-2 complex subunit sigma-1
LHKTPPLTRLCAQFRTHKVIYRRYAGLFFSMCVDTTGASPRLHSCALLLKATRCCAENELVCLESIHLFVEILDTYFSHVCELDLVWHFHKARASARTPAPALH